MTSDTEAKHRCGVLQTIFGGFIEIRTGSDERHSRINLNLRNIVLTCKSLCQMTFIVG